MREDISILIAGQFPPPVTGFAYITQEMARSIASCYETTIIDLSPHRKRGGIGYHFQRMALTLRGVVTLFRQTFRVFPRSFYIACDGDLGIIYTLALCGAARLLRISIFIHHHSFGYIDKRSPLMAFLVAVAGQNATHIFLSQTMLERFTARYTKPLRTTVISNSAFVEECIAPIKDRSPSVPLVLGLISNLNDEKGLSLFLDTLRRALAQSMNVRGILAGPPVTERDRQTILAAVRELGDKLDYRGPLYGEAKAAFFRSLDVFVFPTQYANEAQPTVIFEAMANGVPVLSYDRGCIREQVGKCGLVLPQKEDFVTSAVQWIKAQMDAPQALMQLKLDTRSAFLNDRTKAKETVASLFGSSP